MICDHHPPATRRPRRRLGRQRDGAKEIVTLLFEVSDFATWATGIRRKAAAARAPGGGGGVTAPSEAK